MRTIRTGRFAKLLSGCSEAERPPEAAEGGPGEAAGSRTL